MLESGECTTYYTPNYKLPKRPIGGGHVVPIPVKGFFVNTKIYELDSKGHYPNIVQNNNFSFDTLNCNCCKYNTEAQVKKENIETINEHLRRQIVKSR